MPFIIVYQVKEACGGMEDIPVCVFPGNKKELLARVDELNYHQNYDEVKANKHCRGFFTWQELRELHSEADIRNEADWGRINHFR